MGVNQEKVNITHLLLHTLNKVYAWDLNDIQTHPNTVPNREIFQYNERVAGVVSIKHRQPL